MGMKWKTEYDDIIKIIHLYPDVFDQDKITCDKVKYILDSLTKEELSDIEEQPMHAEIEATEEEKIIMCLTCLEEIMMDKGFIPRGYTRCNPEMLKEE